MKRQRMLIPAVVAGLIIASIVVMLVVRENRMPSSSGYKVGVIIARTGPASFAGRPEGDVLNALQEQLKELNIGPAITLDIKDSGSDKDRAVRYFEEFARDKSVIAIIGPTSSGESIAVAKRSQDLPEDMRLPILSLAATSQMLIVNDSDLTRPNSWVFKFAQNDDLAAVKLAQLIRRHGRENKVVLLHSDDPFGNGGAKVFPSAASNELIKLHSPIASFAGDLTAAGQVVAQVPSDATAVVIWAFQAGTVSRLISEFRAQRPDVSLYLSHGNASQEFLGSVGAAGDGVFLVGSRVLMPGHALDSNTARDKTIVQFQAFWTAARKGEPQSHYAGHAYDAYQMIRNALANKRNDRKAIRNFIETSGPMDGITGTFRFTENDHAGLTVDAFEFYEISNGKFIPATK